MQSASLSTPSYVQDPLAILPASTTAALSMDAGAPTADAGERLWAAMASVPGGTLRQFMREARVELPANAWAASSAAAPRVSHEIGAFFSCVAIHRRPSEFDAVSAAPATGLAPARQPGDHESKHRERANCSHDYHCTRHPRPRRPRASSATTDARARAGRE